MKTMKCSLILLLSGLWLLISLGCSRDAPKGAADPAAESSAAETEDAVDLDWMTDFEKARARSEETGKTLLMDFTGSDWCGWCIKLNEEVFQTQTFADFAKEHLVLLKLDFPRKTPIAPEQRAQNRRLQQEYGVRGYPTILLLDPQGDLIARTGYRRGGAEAYVTHLTEQIGL